MTTAQLIDKLVAHYGSPLAVNRAADAIWRDTQGNRLMMKVDALWLLFESIQKEKA